MREAGRTLTFSNKKVLNLENSAILTARRWFIVPVPAKDGQFVHCSFCNQRFRFGYDANKHEKEMHADQLKSTNL